MRSKVYPACGSEADIPLIGTQLNVYPVKFMIMRSKVYPVELLRRSTRRDSTGTHFTGAPSYLIGVYPVQKRRKAPPPGFRKRGYFGYQPVSIKPESRISFLRQNNISNNTSSYNDLTLAFY
jgi:hypothetical protein